MASGQRSDSEFVFPERVFGPMQEHRRSLGVWGDGSFVPPQSAFFDTTSRPRRGSLSGSYSSAPPSYYSMDTHDDVSLVDYPTMKTMPMGRQNPTRHPSPSSLGYQRSFMNAYFKPASMQHDDGVYRSTPPPPALVDDMARLTMAPTPSAGGYADYEQGMTRYHRASPPPYSSFSGGQSSGHSTPTPDMESERSFVPIRPIAMPTVVQQERIIKGPILIIQQPQQHQPMNVAPTTIVQEVPPTVMPPTVVDGVAGESVIVLPPAPLTRENSGGMPVPTAKIGPAIAPNVSTPTVAVSVGDARLVRSTPTPPPVFIPPPAPGTEAALAGAGVGLPRTVLDVQPMREVRPPAVVREIGPALPPVLAENVSVAAPIIVHSVTPTQLSRASTPSPTPSPKNAMMMNQTPSPGGQIPVATPPGMMRDMSYTTGRFTPPPQSQIPVATPPSVSVRSAPTPPPINVTPIGPVAGPLIVAEDNSDKKVSRFRHKLHKPK